MRVAFLGSPSFVIPPLEELLRAGVEVACVISQPSRQAGRGKAVVDPPPVTFAREKALKVFQPENINQSEFLETFRALEIDVAITASYGQLLSREFLSIPKRATINIHPSLLPKYRGAIPVPAALLDGLRETGVSVLFTVFKMDAGNLIVQEKTSIEPDETADRLTARLFKRGGELLVPALKLLEDETFVGTPQDETQVTRCRKLAKDDGRINWNEPAEKIYNAYRAFYPWPGSFTFLGDRRIVVTAMKLENSARSLEPGQFQYDKATKSLFVGAAKGTLRLEKLKPEGGKELGADAFWNGLKSEQQQGRFS
jgi:methionyl-tRNA formyltransferase